MCIRDSNQPNTWPAWNQVPQYNDGKVLVYLVISMRSSVTWRAVLKVCIFNRQPAFPSHPPLREYFNSRIREVAWFQRCTTPKFAHKLWNRNNLPFVGDNTYLWLFITWIQIHDSFASKEFSLRYLNCFAHDAGGFKHSLSLRTNAQTFGNEWLAQISGLVWRHPSVWIAESWGFKGAWKTLSFDSLVLIAKTPSSSDALGLWHRCV